MLTKVPVAKNQDGLEKALRKIPAGYALLDRSDLLLGAEEGKDPLDVLLDLVEVAPQDSGDGEVRYGRKTRGWLVPVFVGYQAIERQQLRRGVRQADAVGHVFGESLYSVGEFRSIRGLLAKTPDAIASAFWKHQYNPQSETYFVSAAN
jgi:CRISPR type I-F-associated protein Csy2